MKIILLNGPPRCGKDFAAQVIQSALCRERFVGIEKFSRPIKHAFAGMLQTYIRGDEVESFEDRKEEPIPLLSVSYRQWQIDFSEKFMKPQYGRDVFARLFLERIANTTAFGGLWVVSDCGFQVEYDAVIATRAPGDILLLRLHREGCDFRHDSRDYIMTDDSRFVIDLYNDSGPGFALKLLETVRRFVGAQ